MPGPAIPLIAAALPAVGSVIGSLIDKNSQGGANAQNVQLAREQMAFQREQSATEYQRKVEDLKKAGLNPALAYGGSGNSSQSGAAPTVEPETRNTGQTLSNAVLSYQQFATSTAQAQLLREQANVAQAQTRAIQTATEAQKPDAILGQNEGYRAEYVDSKRAQLKAGKFTADRTPEQFEANLRNLNQNTSTAKAAEAELRNRATLQEQDFQNEWFRKNVAPWLNSTAKVGGTARNFLPRF